MLVRASTALALVGPFKCFPAAPPHYECTIFAYDGQLCNVCSPNSYSSNIRLFRKLAHLGGWVVGNSELMACVLVNDVTAEVNLAVAHLTGNPTSQDLC